MYVIKMWWVIFWLLSSLFRIFWKGRIYVIQDVAGKLACNQQLMTPGWPNKNENIEKFFFSSGGGGVPPPPSSGFFSIFPDRVEDWKTLTLQGVDKYKTLCSEKKNLQEQLCYNTLSYVHCFPIEHVKTIFYLVHSVHRIENVHLTSKADLN